MSLPSPGLGGTAVAPAVESNDAEAALAEEEHLGVPVVSAEGPTVAENDGLTCAPVFVENLDAVFGGDGAHVNSPLLAFCGA
jgi:hypothetical protein